MRFAPDHGGCLVFLRSVVNRCDACFTFFRRTGDVELPVGTHDTLAAEWRPRRD